MTTTERVYERGDIMHPDDVDRNHGPARCPSGRHDDHPAPPGYICTRRPPHTHHAAGDGNERVVAVWTDDGTRGA